MIRRTSATTHKQWAFMLLIGYLLLAGTAAVAENAAGYWSSDEGFGTSAGEASGSGYAASSMNGINRAPGRIGEAVSANAALKQYVRIPSIDLHSTHAVSIAFWSKRSYSTMGGHVLLESTLDFTQSTTGFVLFPDDSSCAGIQVAIKGDVGETANCYSQPTSGAWHHLVLVLDKTQSAGNQVRLYVDGVRQNPTRSLAASTNTNYFGINPLYLFSRAGTTMYDNGMIDDLRVYPRALTTSQIQEIYSSGNAQISKDVVKWVDGIGKLTAPPFTTSVNNELLVAFVAYDGPLGGYQTASVTGGGLTWTLRSRSNKQWGTSEIWSATAPKAPFTATISSQPAASASWHGSLTVVGFTNASGTGKVGQANASLGACDISLPNIAAGNWVFAVGNDWDRPTARAPISGQALVHQKVDVVAGDTYWVQSTAAPSTVTGTVDIHDTAPTSDRWNYAAIEIVSANTKPQGTLTPSPSSVNFGKVNINSSASQSVTLTNTGNASLTVSSVKISGPGFSLAPINTPFTLAPGGTHQLATTFAPIQAGAASGTVSVTSNASNPNLSIPLSGTGTTPGPLTATPSSLNFGNVAVNTSSSLSTVLTNSGTGTVTVSGISISGTGFSRSPVTTPFTMAPGGTTILTAIFAPTVTGVASGSIRVTSNATNPNLSIPVRGAGVPSIQHQVTLSWTASTSQVAGYNVYRSTNSNGPFSAINGGLATTTSYVDKAVQSGATYYYYATAVDNQGNQSVASNQVSAVVP